MIYCCTPSIRPATVDDSSCTWVHAGIEDLREKREGILKQVAEEESEKIKIQQELQKLTGRLGQINESLARKVGSWQYTGCCLHVYVLICLTKFCKIAKRDICRA